MVGQKIGNKACLAQSNRMELQHYRQPYIKSPLLRVLLFILALFVVILSEWVGATVYANLFPKLDENSPLFLTLSRGTTLVLTLFLTWFFAKRIDRRPLFKDWFNMNKRKSDLLIGFLFGALLISIASFILGRQGLIEFSPGNISISTWLIYAFLFFIAALWEEVVFRGYIQQNLQKKMPNALALLVTSILFMLIHSTNPNIDIVPRVNLFLAGLMLGAATIYTKSIWFPQGLHWAWNLFQGPVFGYEVSGIGTQALFQQEIKTENLWTGGAFGFEGSILATILIVFATGFTIFLFKKSTKHANA